MTPRLELIEKVEGQERCNSAEGCMLYLLVHHSPTSSAIALQVLGASLFTKGVTYDLYNAKGQESKPRIVSGFMLTGWKRRMGPGLIGLILSTIVILVHGGIIKILQFRFAVHPFVANDLALFTFAE